MTTNATDNMTTTMPTSTGWTLDNYKCSNKGLLLPMINEYTWSIGARAFIYLLGLLWCFLAVAIIADIFMCSIERITSKTTKVRIPDNSSPDGFREIEVRVWNDTVANLSLLALGTSAPEILLSVIEIVGNNFVAGALGPGTIVGSASFNLLVITGICVMSIPSPDIRRVKHTKVFIVTATSCIFAYVWLALVLLVISKNVVEWWEAVLTLVFFPLLIIIAYLADRNFFIGKKEDVEPSGQVGFALDPEGRRGHYQVSGKDEEEAAGDPEASLVKLGKDLGHEVRDGDLPEDQAAKIAAAKLAEGQTHDRGWYRINATRMITGGRKLIPHVLTQFQDIYDHVQLPEEERDDKTLPKKVDHSAGGTKAVCEFSASQVAVLENEGKVRIGMRRHGNLDCGVTVLIETINGTAIAGEDYKPIKEKVTFDKKETLRSIYIEIVDDFEWEPDEFFFVKMCTVEGKEEEHCAIGDTSIIQVTILNDDEPGKLEFAKPSLVVKESYYMARVPVNRINGADGHVSVKWKTKDITAIDGKDYKGGEGKLLFDNGETSKIIEIPLFESNKPERDECFQIELGETDGGAELAKITRCIVTIVNDEEFNGLVSRLINLTKSNLDSLQLESSTYVSQFKDAMNVNGGDLDSATFLDYLLHFLTFGFKIIFAFVPPPKYWGGWPAFIISLSVIGLLTAIIGDLAGVFGCLINLPDTITAITLVALGTSMPDTFASKAAAMGEKTADSSVGNVNGSNSVNVFLGLGMPWVIAVIYWGAKTGEYKFDVPAGSLGFSVVIYTCCAILAILTLVLRRNVKLFGNAELGGPTGPKIASGIFFICLWFFYIIMSVLNSYGVIKMAT